MSGNYFLILFIIGKASGGRHQILRNTRYNNNTFTRSAHAPYYYILKDRDKKKNTVYIINSFFPGTLRRELYYLLS